MEYEIGQTYSFGIVYTTKSGIGVAWGDEDVMILIENVKESDSVINAKVTDKEGDVILANRISRVSESIAAEVPDEYVEDPYEEEDDSEEEIED